MDKLKEFLEKHRFHIRKLETLLRMLDNMSVEVNQVLHHDHIGFIITYLPYSFLKIRLRRLKMILSIILKLLRQIQILKRIPISMTRLTSWMNLQMLLSDL